MFPISLRPAGEHRGSPRELGRTGLAAAILSALCAMLLGRALL